MSSFENCMANLKIAYQAIKNDFDNQKHDLFLLKTHAQELLNTISDFKENPNDDLSKYAHQKLIKLILDTKQLIKSIDHEIEIQAKEEYFNSNNTGI